MRPQKMHCMQTEYQLNPSCPSSLRRVSLALLCDTKDMSLILPTAKVTAPTDINTCSQHALSLIASFRQIQQLSFSKNASAFLEDAASPETCNLQRRYPC